MTLVDISPRTVAAVALLALLPVLWYGFGSSLTAGFVSSINVLLIFGSLYLAFSPVADGHDGNGHGGASA
ncbi:cytochrome-ba3 oxidase subunit [Salinilacihabitans rarus]|uniref:cytochrome-ba3 oxidase subunit n=1 Tax=Salinilacihabitans rarus TaxID=2961596 RepID=UPI0020C90F48|nr:cytochrome-ba3 oxidase subunit [Salinilacihabitans rarus]